MAALLWFLNVVTDALQGAKRRWRCIRHGHLFLCITDGHLCTKCGRFWGDFD